MHIPCLARGIFVELCKRQFVSSYRGTVAIRYHFRSERPITLATGASVGSFISELYSGRYVGRALTRNGLGITYGPLDRLRLQGCIYSIHLAGCSWLPIDELPNPKRAAVVSIHLVRRISSWHC